MTTPDVTEPILTCCACLEPVPQGQMTLDVSVSYTRYDENGEPTKTLIEPYRDDIPITDLQICQECEERVVRDKWNRFVQDITGA